MATQSSISAFCALVLVAGTVGFTSSLAGDELKSVVPLAQDDTGGLPPAFMPAGSSVGTLPSGVTRIPAVSPPPAFRPPNSTSNSGLSANPVASKPIEPQREPLIRPMTYGHWMDRAATPEHSSSAVDSGGAVRIASTDDTFRSPIDSLESPQLESPDWKGPSLKPPTNFFPGRAAQYAKPAPWQVWWRQQVSSKTLTSARKVPVRLNQLMELALVNSPAINIARLDVAIEREGIPEQLGRFDWNAFVEKLWTDTDEPTGSELQAGMGEFRLLEEDFRSEAGLRRTNKFGGQFEIGQELQVRDSNSQFFDPQDQGLSRLTLRYDQPLLREGGVLVNMGRVYIAEHLSQAVRGDSQAAIRDLLFEVATRYWALYRERGNVLIREALYKSAVEMLEEIKKRGKIDADRRLIVLAEATVTLRRANLLQSRTALREAQNELAFFVSVPCWEAGAELLPQDVPFENLFPADERSELQVALTRRSEMHAAIQRIQASAVQKSIAENDLLPRLALQLSMSAAGINGDFDVGESFLDQFSKGAPTYTVGFSFEQPIQNRTAKARNRRAALEMARFTAQLDETTDIVKVEIKNAVTQVHGFYGQLQQFATAANKAQEEIAAITRRRWLFPDLNGITTLYLREILDAQERLGTAEQQFLDAQTRYSLAILDLRRANGTLWSEDPLNSNCLPPAGVPIVGTSVGP